MRPIVSDTPYKHIYIMDDGRAMIGGTRIKVQYIAIDTVTWNRSPEEIKEGYEGLTMGQIHSALAYYWDNKDLVDAQIQEEVEYIEEMMRRDEPRRKGARKRLMARARDMGLEWTPHDGSQSSCDGEYAGVD